MNFVEFFSGAGGLSLGFSLSGFTPANLIDNNKDCIATILLNRRLLRVKSKNVTFSDIRQIDFNALNSCADVLCAGPPCQPFSFAGKHLASKDNRDFFSDLAGAIVRMQPSAFVIENVRGLARQQFRDYFEYVKLLLAYPELLRMQKDDWAAHFRKLKRHRRSNPNLLPMYQITELLLNSADFGIPQKRERVFLVGFRSDLNLSFIPPQTSHSIEMLLHSQWITGEYWDVHRISKNKRPILEARVEAVIRKIDFASSLYCKLPWLTVRDALTNLPKPSQNGSISGHTIRNGARAYAGHTGSKMDTPAKTIKAGTHGVAGGENTVILDGGGLRYFTVRECARLQTFPDDYEFVGSWSSVMKQIGNAVPVRLASVIASSLIHSMAGREMKQKENILFPPIASSIANSKTVASIAL